MTIEIGSRQEYDYVASRCAMKGYSPLIDFNTFIIPFKLRYEIQKELFPKYSRENNLKFYRWYWDNYPFETCCEETGIYIPEYGSEHISHILPRGGYTHMAYDARNINLLSRRAHDTWGNPITRREMRIYKRNQEIIYKLRSDYQNL